MPVYTFYPYRSDGAALTFEAIDCEDDQAAKGHARVVLSRHGSADTVEVWLDAEQITTARRGPTTAPPLDPSSAQQPGN